MSAELITAIGGALVLVLGAVGLLLQQVLKQVGKLVESTKEIHKATNGVAAASSRELSALRGEVQNLRDRLDESHQAAADVRAALDKEISSEK